MIDKTWLNNLGWTHLDDTNVQLAESAYTIGRITRQDRQHYTVITRSGLKRAQLMGKTRQKSFNKSDLPVVGDWIGIETDTGSEGAARILQQYPRKSALCRQAAGEVKEKQILAANIDTVFVISGLDQNFNVNRIERFLMMAWSSNLPVVLLLNKADLFPDHSTQLQALEPILSGSPVHAISALAGTATDTIMSYLGPGKSAALVGSSGVGKSTLVNQLMGTSHMKTKEVRAFDDKGRHTTTHRELCILPNDQGILIDTPGMREAQLWVEPGDISNRYSDIVSLSAGCKYSDCRHSQEPRCNVRAAVAEGTLSQYRLTQYQKLTAYLI